MTVDELPDTDGAVLRWVAVNGIRRHLVLDFALGDETRVWWSPGSPVPRDDAFVVESIGTADVEVFA